MKRIAFNEDWYFSPEDIGEESARTCPGASVTLPHTFNAQDGQMAETRHAKAWYSKAFPCPSLEKGQRIYLECKAVNAVAEVYLNGQMITSHKGGYSCFRADLTDHLRAENVLVISADNRIRDDVYPAVADFTFYGGIYRDVNLLIVHESHFALDDFGGCGVKVDTDGSGNVTVTTSQTGGTAAIAILDAEGKALTSGGSGEGMHIPSPHLWDGVRDPYLYYAEAVLYDGGIETDRIRILFGFRSYHVDPEKGFFLNGKPYPLRGASRHQDRPDIGNALLPCHHEEDIRLMLEMGANSVRLAHYQQDDFVYELCDRTGLVVWSEIPYISKHTDAGLENLRAQLKELIAQTYNHPSIIIRGISNEITMVKAEGSLMDQTHRDLCEMCRDLDSNRLTAAAVYCLTNPKEPYLRHEDLLAHNLYGGWYGTQGTAWNGRKLDAYHRLFPTVPQGLSEFGADALTEIHSRRPRKGDNSEEYQCVFHEKLLKIIEDRPYLWCAFAWNMFDFAADRRKTGPEKGKNHKGLVSFDRTIRKDAFYLYKAHWSEAPFVHICGKRFEYRKGRKLQVKVYSNQSEVSLYCNGDLIGTQKGQCVFTFSLPMKETMSLKVVSGDCGDEAVFHQGKRNYNAASTDRRSWEQIL